MSSLSVSEMAQHFGKLNVIYFIVMFVKRFNKYADNNTRSRVISEMHQEDLNTMMKSDNTYLFIGIHKILFQIN